MAALLGACGGGGVGTIDSKSELGASKSPLQACTRVVRAMSAAVERCGPTPSSVVPLSKQREEEVAGECESTLKLPGVPNQLSELDACAQEFANAGCNQIRANAVRHCFDPFAKVPGSLAVGEECSIDWQCGGDCGWEPNEHECGPGHCLPYAKRGESCDASHPCIRGTVCSSKTNTCEPALGCEEEPCECPPGMVSRTLTTRPPFSATLGCVPIGHQGDTCTGDGQCADGLRCGGTDGKCKPAASEGDACNGHSNDFVGGCGRGLFCDRGSSADHSVCRSVPQAGDEGAHCDGERTLEGTSLDCRLGLVCSDEQRCVVAPEPDACEGGDCLDEPPCQ